MRTVTLRDSQALEDNSLPSIVHPTIASLGDGKYYQPRSDTVPDKKVVVQKSQLDELRLEARALTLSLYRLCCRSIRLIRYGNEHDEKEFEKREKSYLEKDRASFDTMFAMLPPVDRVDELRSRAEYYGQYANENFLQEADCLDGDWTKHKLQRYLHFLRKGENDRKWLLRDMKFNDPYDLDQGRIRQFEKKAIMYIAGGFEEQYYNADGNETDDHGSWVDEDEDDDDDDDDPVKAPPSRRNSH